MALSCIALFRICSPPPELLEYPLYFPAPSFRDRRPPEAEEDEGNDGAAELEHKQVEAVKIEVSAQKQKFLEIAGDSPTVPLETAVAAAKELGCSPTQAEIGELHAKNPEGIRFEVFNGWLSYCAQQHRDSVANLVQALEVFDPKHTGTLNRTQLRTALTDYGEALTSEEFDVLLETLNIRGENIDYHKFVERLLSD